MRIAAADFTVVAATPHCYWLSWFLLKLCSFHLFWFLSANSVSVLVHYANSLLCSLLLCCPHRLLLLVFIKGVFSTKTVLITRHKN